MLGRFIPFGRREDSFTMGRFGQHRASSPVSFNLFSLWGDGPIVPNSETSNAFLPITSIEESSKRDQETVKILDYESGRSLTDVGLQLSREEAREMRDYLTRLLEEPSVSHAYLTELGDHGIEKELAIAIDGPREAFIGSRKLPLPRIRPLSVA